uniref:Transmembrane protein n=2 Tax=Cucumis melo TaxID=3656 RepID=A0A9I9CYU4_CUCME
IARGEISSHRTTISNSVLHLPFFSSSVFSSGFFYRSFCPITISTTVELLKKMVKVATFFAMSLGAFVFWQSMDKLHVWIALRQDEKKERMEKEAEIRRVREELLQQAKQNDSLA